MATGVRVGITLACTGCRRRNYQTQKSKRNSPDRVEFQEHCRWCGSSHFHRQTGPHARLNGVQAALRPDGEVKAELPISRRVQEVLPLVRLAHASSGDAL